MKRLILVRHAKSSWDDPVLADFDRPLSPRGQRDAPEMGRRLAARGELPDRLLTSPARRAATTARTLAKEIGFARDDIAPVPELYGASAEALLEIVRRLDPGTASALLVGHNPGFTDLVNALTGAGLANLPTGGVAEIDLAVDSWAAVGWATGRLAVLDTPRRPASAGG